MRFDGYYSNPQYNDRYTNYLKFYPDGLVAGMNWEHGVPDLTRLRFSGSNTALGRGRWRLEDGALHPEGASGRLGGSGFCGGFGTSTPQLPFGPPPSP